MEAQMSRLVTRFAAKQNKSNNYKFIKTLLVSMLAFSATFFYGCGRLPTTVEENGNSGTLEIHAMLFSTSQASALQKESVSFQTSCDSLVIEISGPDIEKVRSASKMDYSQSILLDTLAGIPAGKDREIYIYTVNRSGAIIHVDSCGRRTVDISPGSSLTLSAVLVPVRGSIYLQIGAVPTSVDSVFASFISSDSSWNVHVRRSPRVNISIDNIPHRTSGKLVVAGISIAGDTLYKAEEQICFNAVSLESIPLVFAGTPGGTSLQMSIELPGATVAGGTMGNEQAQSTESGALIITEIQYAANDSEYIELFNPSSRDTTIDTLIIDIDGAQKKIFGVSIKAGACFVIGRCALPWASIAYPSSSALDLSGSGNWITVKAGNGATIDRVSFVGGTNDLEWPVVSGKKSIVLKSGITDPVLNNYGRNWTAASTLIPGSSSQFGTPGIR
jgi:hypothetical protein